MDNRNSRTESVCPTCLKRIPAERSFEGQDVFLVKTCEEHGSFRSILWRGEPGYKTWQRHKIPSYPTNPITLIDQGCPYDCGLCPEHRQHTCSVLLEVTQRCDLLCPVCFADSGTSILSDWSMEEINDWYQRLMNLGGHFNIQISGGEPCVRDDLAEIIRMGRNVGFSFFQLNTNGIRLANDPEYLAKLQSAGLSSIFLQFDGTKENIFREIRGRNLLNEKLKLIELCQNLGIGVVLVPTIIPGVNESNLGEIIKFAADLIPTVRGVHFQPISYFGRFPHAPKDVDRITLPEIMRAIVDQTSGLINLEAFTPPGCENALCSFHANFVLMPDGVLKSLNYSFANACDCQPVIAAEGAARARRFVAENWSLPTDKTILKLAESPSLGDWDLFLERKRSHSFCISAMAFQDAWTLDLDRLRDCCIHVASPDGRLVPFCAYNLTNIQGNAIYRK